jgi:hypothetical protein
MYKILVKKVTFVDLDYKGNYNKITKWFYQFGEIGRNKKMLHTSHFATSFFYTKVVLPIIKHVNKNWKNVTNNNELRKRK